MDRKTRGIFLALFDFFMLGVLIFSVYKIIWCNNQFENFFSGIIVICIPIIFYNNYMFFAGDKYTFSDLQDDEQEDLEEFERGKGKDNVNTKNR